MNKVFALALCVLAVATTLEAAPGDKFTTKYDNVNIDEVLSNEKLLMNYYNCIMDKGKCTPDGAELRSLGVAVLSKAFNTFAMLPPELQPVINDFQQTITNEYVTEVDKFNNFRVVRKK